MTERIEVAPDVAQQAWQHQKRQRQNEFAFGAEWIDLTPEAALNKCRVCHEPWPCLVAQLAQVIRDAQVECEELRRRESRTGAAAN